MKKLITLLLSIIMLFATLTCVPIMSQAATLSKPTGLKVVSTTSSSIKLSWNKVSNASGYLIYRSTKKTGKFTQIADVAGGSTTAYTIKKLASSKTYYFKLKAYNLYFQTSSCSAITYGKTKAVPSLKSRLLSRNWYFIDPAPSDRGVAKMVFYKNGKFRYYTSSKKYSVGKYTVNSKSKVTANFSGDKLVISTINGSGLLKVIEIYRGEKNVCVLSKSPVNSENTIIGNIINGTDWYSRAIDNKYYLYNNYICNRGSSNYKDGYFSTGYYGRIEHETFCYNDDVAVLRWYTGSRGHMAILERTSNTDKLNAIVIFDYYNNINCHFEKWTRQ